jgi:hypothetical protein
MITRWCHIALGQARWKLVGKPADHPEEADLESQQRKGSGVRSVDSLNPLLMLNDVKASSKNVAVDSPPKPVLKETGTSCSVNGYEARESAARARSELIVPD